MAVASREALDHTTSNDAGCSRIPLRSGGGAAGAAEADDLDLVVGGHEAVTRCDGVGPGAEVALLDLDDAMAAGAEQVMVVRIAAQAIAELAAVVGERVDDALLVEEREGAVDRREADRGGAAAQAAPQRLGRKVVALACELLEHLEPLARRADAPLLEQTGERLVIRLRRARHGPILARMTMRTILVISCLGLTFAAEPVVAAGGTLRVVAAENAYGDIAAQIGGAHVSLTSILTDPNADPHLFEPGTSNALAVARARVVIQNGLGYDAFMSKLEDASPSAKRTVVTVADVLGIRGKDANPHLWYDVPALGRIAGAIAGALERADPSHAAAYRAGLRRFSASLRPLRAEVALVQKRFHGQPVATTEPVPGYLVAAAGLRDLAPSEFTRAIESGTEPSPRAFAEMMVLLSDRRVRVLLYNSQAVSPITSRVRDAAAKAGIPVVPVRETLPAHRSLQDWLLGETRALSRALAP